MTENQVHQLITSGILPDSQECQDLIETHISWVIICQRYVYKIKKPVCLSFVDFSTLEKRKYFCDQEVSLNQRLTHNMYLNVLAITFTNGIYRLGSDIGAIVDYAVVMKRIDNSKEMRRLLINGKVGESDIIKIADQLVDFHQKAQIINGTVTPQVLIEDFADIEQTRPFIKRKIGESASDKLSEAITVARKFIDHNTKLIKRRDEEGFIRDCHGDLHSGNIFLLKDPVIFDCIEFSEQLRQIDILNELAFFSMDLEFHNRMDLSKSFIQAYNQAFQVIRNKSEEQLLLFYKLYRANVKAKVIALKTEQARIPEEIHSHLNLFKKYFALMVKYSELSK